MTCCSFGIRSRPKKTAGGCPAVLEFGLRLSCLCACLSIRRAVRERKIGKKPGARNHGRQCSTAPRDARQRQAGDRRHGSQKSVVDRRRRRPSPRSPAAPRGSVRVGTSRRHAHRLQRRPADAADRRHAARCSRCAASTASAATTPRTRARWGRTRPASRRSSSRSRATRSSSSRPARPPTIPYPPLTKNYHYEIELVAALGKGGAQRPDRAGARRSSTATRSAST